MMSSLVSTFKQTLEVTSWQTRPLFAIAPIRVILLLGPHTQWYKWTEPEEMGVMETEGCCAWCSSLTAVSIWWETEYVACMKENMRVCVCCVDEWQWEPLNACVFDGSVRTDTPHTSPDLFPVGIWPHFLDIVMKRMRKEVFPLLSPDYTLPPVRCYIIEHSSLTSACYTYHTYCSTPDLLP